MFEDYYKKQVKRLVCELGLCDPDDHQLLLNELVNYTSKALTQSELNEAVKNLYTADSEKLARIMFDNRVLGVTLGELSTILCIPICKVKNRMVNLRNNGFEWYAYQESYKVYRYHLTGLNV